MVCTIACRHPILTNKFMEAGMTDVWAQTFFVLMSCRSYPLQLELVTHMISTFNEMAQNRYTAEYLVT